MECIQRKFRLQKVNKLLGILNLHTENKSFDDFTIIIRQSKVLKEVTYILSLINQIANYKSTKPIIGTTTFLASFVISGYPNDTLSQPMGPIRGTTEMRMNDTILKTSKELVSKFNSLSTISDVKSFYRMLILYKDTFKAWKNMDLRSLIHTLAVSYYDIDDIITAVEAETTMKEGHTIEEKKEYIALCREQQEDIINKVVFLNGQEHFNNYRREEISMDDSMRKHIQDVMYKAYWDILDRELNSDPPIFEQLIKILTEIRDLFCQFVPNRPEIQDEIKDKIDPDLIKNMAEHGAWDDQNLYGLVMYMISLIKQFQPKVMDQNVEEWEKELTETLQKPIVYSEFLRNFLHTVFNMIQQIMGYFVVAKKELEQD